MIRTQDRRHQYCPILRGMEGQFTRIRRTRAETAFRLGQNNHFSPYFQDFFKKEHLKKVPFWPIIELMQHIFIDGHAIGQTRGGRS